MNRVTYEIYYAKSKEMTDYIIKVRKFTESDLYAIILDKLNTAEANDPATAIELSDILAKSIGLDYSEWLKLMRKVKDFKNYNRLLTSMRVAELVDHNGLVKQDTYPDENWIPNELIVNFVNYQCFGLGEFVAFNEEYEVVVDSLEDTWYCDTVIDAATILWLAVEDEKMLGSFSKTAIKKFKDSVRFNTLYKIISSSPKEYLVKAKELKECMGEHRFARETVPRIKTPYMGYNKLKDISNILGLLNSYPREHMEIVKGPMLNLYNINHEYGKVLRKRKFIVPAKGIVIKMKSTIDDINEIYVNEIYLKDKAYLFVGYYCHKGFSNHFCLDMDEYLSQDLMTAEKDAIALIITLKMYQIMGAEVIPNIDFELLAPYKGILDRFTNDQQKIKDKNKNISKHTPRVHTKVHLNPFVRKLPTGWKRSYEAELLASKLHIDLEEGYTLVNEHDRQY